MQSVSKLKTVEVYLLIDIEKSSRNAVNKMMIHKINILTLYRKEEEKVGG